MKLLRNFGGALLASLVWGPAQAPAATRLLYASDWNGPTQIFAADPGSGRTVGQLTFDHSALCGSLSIACGFVDPLPSPDGRKVAYVEAGAEGSPSVLWIADADGRNARRIGETANSLAPSYAKRDRYAVWSVNSKELAYQTAQGVRFVRADGRGNASGRWWRGWPEYDVAVSPNHRWVATATNRAIVLTDGRTGRSSVLLRKEVLSLAWSPDSRAIAYVEGRMGFDDSATGDLGVLTRSGRDRTVVHDRGQIESVAWTKAPRRIKYRAPDAVNGVFSGGPIAHLAADGDSVGFAACVNVVAWTPRTGAVSKIERRGGCLAPGQREEIYDLAVAGDRVAWGEKTGGLVFHWSLYAARLAPAVERYELATGSNALGSNWFGAGALAGSGGALIYSAWQTSPDPASGFPVTAMTLFRVTAAGCPCPAIGYAAARQNFDRGSGLTPIVALDTDGARIAALRYDNLVLLDTSGTELAAFNVRAAAAQLAGDEVVALVPNELRVYSANGALQRTWPVPSSSVGRDCRYYSEPQCLWRAELTLQDAARGLAAYVFRAEVHVVRLADGRDTVVGYGSEARFMNDGLVYADGARVRLIPFAQLDR